MYDPVLFEPVNGVQRLADKIAVGNVIVFLSVAVLVFPVQVDQFVVVFPEDQGRGPVQVPFFDVDGSDG